MAPKRKRGNFGKGKSKFKKKKLNLMTIRQRRDYEEYGESHPAELSDNVKNYTKVQETQSHEKKGDYSSSSDSEEEEVPIMKQLFQEIGLKEEEPESEKEDSEEDGTDEDEELDDGEDEINDGDDDMIESDSEELEDDNETDNSEDNGEVLNTEHGDALQESESEEDGEGEDVDGDKNNTIEHQTDESEEDEYAEEEDDLCLKESDPFSKHFETETDLTELDEGNRNWTRKQLKLSGLGQCVLVFKDASFLPEPDTSTDLKKLHVKLKLKDQVPVTNTKLASVALKPGAFLTSSQHKLFCMMNCYQDLLYPHENKDNIEEIRFVYCLHTVNHVLKTRSRVIAHNAKLRNRSEQHEDDVEYRDQGLTRPKVLILLPYRDRALKVVNMIMSLLSSTQQANVSNLKRFEGEFSEMHKTEGGHKPDDYQKLFEGNTDDNFRVGISVSKKSLRLYSPFYESDIILGSPLGLRTVIGEEGDRDRDYDFLSSIEVLIVDQTDVFLMQNWDHFLHVFKHLHLQPKESHGVDFSRVRMWSINGWSKHFRQTLIFSQMLLPEMLTLFNKHCHNYSGKILVQRNVKTGTIRSCLTDAPQVFHRVACDSPSSTSQKKVKFEYFKNKILTYHTSAGMKQTLIYCNYFSFVQLRNYFREAEVDFLFMNEYDSERDVRNARIHFRKRHPHFLLYTERLHFHYRFKLRAIHHIVWFDLPNFPHFYPELVNLMETTTQACTTTTLFTKYDGQKLMEIVGQSQAAHMLSTEKSVNMITVS